MSEPAYSILIVDDEEHIRNALARIFRGGEHFVETAADGVEALEKCRNRRFHAAVVDLMMPRMGGEELLGRMREEHPDTAVIILTAHGSIRSAVDAVKAGAYDYLTKPFSLEDTREKVLRACRFKSLESENLRLRDQLRERHRYQNLVGSSPPMQKIFELIERVSRNDSTVLIQGESGTGKEQVARAIHFAGPRASEPFAPVDCGAVTPTLIESELFGHVKGAFTGAHASTEGLLRAAGAGTILLDEIGELPLDVQAKLLRALQEREVRPVGSTEVFPIAARVIAATNRDLEEAVNQGTFREDLYYRLNVVIIKLPPLRERIEDVPIIARHLLKRLAEAGSPVVRIAPQALKLLTTYPWPGNIRELQNALEHAVAIGNDDEVVTTDELPEKVRRHADAGASRGYIGDGSAAAYEREALSHALERTGGNRRAAARMLRISEPTLYRKLKRYGLTGREAPDRS